MQIKSNMDLLERLTIAAKLSNHANDIILDKLHGNEPIKPLTASEASRISDDLVDIWTAVAVPLFQARKGHTEKYIHFPHQNKQLNKIFGNHHVTRIDKVEHKDNKLILTLGHRRKAMTAIVDVLNDRLYRKDPNIEAAYDNVPSGRGNLITKDCNDPKPEHFKKYDGPLQKKRFYAKPFNN